MIYMPKYKYDYNGFQYGFIKYLKTKLKFEIIYTCYDIEDIAVKLVKYIIDNVENSKTKILFYRVKNINPTCVSYDMLTNSGFDYPTVNFTITNIIGRQACRLYYYVTNCKNLYNEIYLYFYIINNY